MSLTGPQKVTVAEITYETPAKINEITVSLDADIETAIIADIAVWNEKRSKQAIRLSGGRDGMDLNVERLLEAVTIRVRNALGLSPLPSRLCPIGDVYAGGISVSDMQAQSSNPDSPTPAFTVGLHQC